MDLPQHGPNDDFLNAFLGKSQSRDVIPCGVPLVVQNFVLNHFDHLGINCGHIYEARGMI